MVIENELTTLTDKKNSIESSVRNSQLSPEVSQIIADSLENDAISCLSSIKQRIAYLNNVARDLNLLSPEKITLEEFIKSIIPDLADPEKLARFSALSEDDKKLFVEVETQIKLNRLKQTRDLLVLSQTSHSAVMARDSSGENNAVPELTTVNKEIADLKQIALKLDLAIS